MLAVGRAVADRGRDIEQEEEGGNQGRDSCHGKIAGLQTNPGNFNGNRTKQDASYGEIGPRLALAGRSVQVYPNAWIEGQGPSRRDADSPYQPFRDPRKRSRRWSADPRGR